MLDARERVTRVRRTELAREPGRLPADAGVELAVPRRILRAQHERRHTGLDRGRHVLEERLHRIPLRAPFGWICDALRGRTCDERGERACARANYWDSVDADRCKEFCGV